MTTLEKLNDCNKKLTQLISEVKEGPAIHGERTITFQIDGEKMLGYLRGPYKKVIVNAGILADSYLVLGVIERNDAIKVVA